MISKLIDSMEIDHLLNYGNSVDLTDSLSPERSFKYQVFDGTVPKYADDPIPADMVACIDSLSDIKPHQVDGVLDKLETLVEHVLFLTLNTELMPLEWWMPRIMDRFDLQRVQVTSKHQMCIVAYRADLQIH